MKKEIMKIVLKLNFFFDVDSIIMKKKKILPEKNIYLKIYIKINIKIFRFMNAQFIKPL
jgi:hypothetical protein